MATVYRPCGWQHRLFVTLVSAALLLCLPTGAGANNKAAAKKQELAKVKARIATVKQRLDKAVARRGHLTTQLRATEKKLGAAQTSLQRATRSLTQANRKLASIKREQAQEKRKLDAQKTAIASQIRAAYIAGSDSRLKLILNQQNPAQVQRMLVYYDYFNRARASRIAAFNSRLHKLAHLHDARQGELAHLSHLEDERQLAFNKVKKRRDKRHAVLAKVNTSIHNQNATLAALKQSRQQLKRLIAQLTNALADIPQGLDSHSFATLRGKLHWPVAGKHIARYGAPRAAGRLRWDGVLIAAKPGEPVHAIAHGRVIYAGWLPRFGQLLIIDHGGGYMSLYAHNQSLYKAVGDWVKAGDAIAAVGNTGGQSQAALLFEIRHNKKPVNPGVWCRR